MSATRLDTTSWLAGATLLGGGGFGVRGDAIPATGDAGPGYAYGSLSLPADAGKEICGRVTTWPTSGTLIPYEDTSFSFSGAPDGSYSFLWQLYVDGIAVGSPVSVTLNIGVVSLELIPNTKSIVLTGYSPFIVQSVAGNFNPLPKQISILGYAPNVLQSNLTDLTPLVKSLLITGYAPLIIQTEPLIISPNVKSIILTGYAPVIRQGVPYYGFLIIEDGSIVPNANSYVDLTFARAYALSNGLILPIDDLECEAALLNGMEFIESFSNKFQGHIVSSDQTCQFPRNLVYVNGFQLPNTVIPLTIKKAQVQAASLIASGINLFETVNGQMVTEETVGPITTKYDAEYLSTADGMNDYKAVTVFLQPLFIVNSGYRLTARHGF